MANTNIKGIWLPIDILINSELNDKEKIILSLILFFSKEKRCCDINNEQLSELVLVTEDRVSRLVGSLKKNGYIDAKYHYKEGGKKITSRIITPLADKIGCYNDLMGIGENTNKDSSKRQQPIGEKAKDILYNNINNNKFNKNSKNHFQGGCKPYKDSQYENMDFGPYYANQ